LRQLFWPLVVSVALALVLPFIFFGTNSFLTVVGLAAGIWVGLSSLVMPLGRAFNSAAVRLTRAQWGMCIAHLGVGVFIIAATVTSGYSVEQDVAARVGQQWRLAGYELEFRELRRIEGQNFTADEAELEVRQDGRYVATLRPQRRAYPVREVVMTESSIDANAFRDVLIALSDPVGDGAWSIHARYKPLVRFIWIACVIMALGGLLAATDSRYLRPKELREPAKPNVGAPAEAGGR
jgi:cytochrome c-type biogenesis protein CcmF